VFLLGLTKALGAMPPAVQEETRGLAIPRLFCSRPSLSEFFHLTTHSVSVRGKSETEIFFYNYTTVIF
jgi:hypothetical protein